MCGIAGIVHFDGAPIPERLAERMCAAIAHRGPDDRGVVSMPRDQVDGRRPRAAFGNQRLSIIDVAGGHQPIANEDATIWTVLNGEIYNFKEVRARLSALGHRFATQSDTEVIVHGYEQWGEAVVEELDGMFALAVWDGRTDRVLLARDRFGKKPLLYYEDETRLVFASEFQALLPVPGIDRELDVTALGAYLAYMSVPAPRTMYRRVKKLSPAHLLTRDRAGSRLHRYWSLAFTPKKHVTDSDAVDCTKHLLRSAVKKRLMSEVPLGAFLSGGVDSSVVVGLMAELSGRPVKTFSIGFDEPQYDELPYARRVAAAFGCEHHEFVVRPAAVDVLPALARHFGEPFADSSAIPSWYLAQLTRQHVTVALNGDGGDEIFAGYGRHLGNDLAERWQKLPAPFRVSAGRVAHSRLLADVGGRRAARFADAAALSRSDRYRAWAGVFSPDAIAELSPVADSEESVVPREFDAARTLDAVDSFLAVDTNVYLPSDLLAKVDITSMAHSLEVRSPLLDRELAEFVAAMPASFKLRRLTTKYLLKKAAAGLVPEATLRRPKRGFAVPIARWFRGELRPFLSDHLQPSELAQSGVLKQKIIDRLIADHLGGARDYAHHLFVLLMLELWHRQFMHA
jgi:asparagine synthase (glutamine-hydrolysing)